MQWPKRVIMRRKNGKRRGLTENSFFPENVNKISTLLYNHSNRFLNNAFDKKQQKDLKENKNKEQLNDKVSRTTFTTTDASRLKLGVTIVPLLNISKRNLHECIVTKCIITKCRCWKHILKRSQFHWVSSDWLMTRPLPTGRRKRRTAPDWTVWVWLQISPIFKKRQLIDCRYIKL